jgi:hypothetical protein
MTWERTILRKMYGPKCEKRSAEIKKQSGTTKCREVPRYCDQNQN